MKVRYCEDTYKIGVYFSFLKTPFITMYNDKTTPKNKSPMVQ